MDDLSKEWGDIGIVDPHIEKKLNISVRYAGPVGGEEAFYVTFKDVIGTSGPMDRQAVMMVIISDVEDEIRDFQSKLHPKQKKIRTMTDTDMQTDGPEILGGGFARWALKTNNTEYPSFFLGKMAMWIIAVFRLYRLHKENPKLSGLFNHTFAISELKHLLERWLKNPGEADVAGLDPRYLS